MLIGEAVLRANPGYELVLLDRLEQAERQVIAEEAGGHDIPYGLLRPVDGSDLHPRVVSTDTALLFLTLAVPGPCPAYVRDRLGERLTSSLGRLVLDGIIEVEVDGTFRSGATGWAPLAPPGVESGRGGRTAELSIEAVRYGQALLTVAAAPAELIATRLYMYGRRPLTPALVRRVDDDVVPGDVRAALQRSWVETRQASPDSPWRSWQPRRAPTRRGLPTASFKLYVSPTVETVPDALGAVVDGLGEAPGVLGFKVGRTPDGIARPDKMVAYFASLAELREGADRIRERATDCRPHGVPFTAAVTGDGLLSWAIDPPHATGHAGRASWRTWVTTRLGDYLVDARPAGATPSEAGEPWQIALARLRLDGVDTVSWVPDQAIFDGAAR